MKSIPLRCVPSSQQPMLHSISRRPRDERRAAPCAYTCRPRCRSSLCVPLRGRRPRRIAVYLLTEKPRVLMRLAGSVWHRTPIYSRSQGVLCKRPAVFWRALGVQPLGNKAINKYVQLETEATQGIDPRGRFENVISYWSPENSLCKTSDLASACETPVKGRIL